jgi:hypothetical protein
MMLLFRGDVAQDEELDVLVEPAQGHVHDHACSVERRSPQVTGSG